MSSVFDAIADGLAKNGYAVADQFLSQKEVVDIRLLEDFQHSTSKFRKAGIGKQQQHQVNESIRGDLIRWLDKASAPEALVVYLDRVAGLMRYLNENLFLSLKDFESHMTSYPAGSYYKRHLDQFKKDDHRKLSLVCYLNENWMEEQGGQLRLYLPDGSKDIYPVAGRLACFRSDLVEHEVLPASRERLSITGWLLDQFSGIRA